MSSKDKENKSLQDKLKQYFKFNKGGTGNFKSRTDFALSTDLERELGSDTPINKRLKAIKDLTEDVLNNRLEDKGVEKLWLCLRDLLQPDQPKEHRHLVFAFLRSLIQGQYEQLTIMRGHFFRVIKDHNVAGDIQPRFEMLQTLTENGKDIKNFEEEIGQFMLEWMPNIVSPLPIQDFLLMIVNLVKFNATYLDEEIVAGFVNNTCYLCCYSGSPQVVMACLQVLEAIVCYSIFPHDALHTFVAALCRTVNVEQYCQTSWKIMRNVLGTDLGHAALFVMCTALSNNAAGDAGLTRGAVFYINMALWGAKRVNTLRATHASVLPSFLSALDSNQSVVTYEVILALQSLINRHGRELHEPAWDIVFKILSKIIFQIEQMPTPNPLIVSHLHETITSVEQLVEVRAFNGDIETMFTVIDRCGHTRPEQSVLKLIAHRAAQIVPMRHDWLSALAGLVERYCRQETRVAVRLHILLMLQRIVQLNRNGFEEELLDRVVLPNLQHCSSEADPTIRCASAKLLVELATQCHSKGCGGLLDILEKLLNRQFELYVTNEAISLPVDSNISDIRTVVHGLVKIFHSKLFKLSANHSVKVYLIMVKHLELHYGRPSLFENHPCIRMKILEFFLSARANTYCHIGFCYDAVGNPISASNAANPASRDKPSFSPYVCVESGTAVASDGSSRVVGAHSPVAHGQVNVSYVSVRKACKLIIACLTQERDWAVLSLVLGEIPSIMQNKALILPKHNNDIDMLATALCAMVADKSLNLPESLRVTSGTKLMKSDFHTAVLGVLACLAPYHTNLDPQTQQKIIKCLIKFGLCERPTVSRLPQQCITALTIFTLEMRDTMVKLLPDVLLELSKISASPPIAGPMLEFLSTLTRLPKVFASFVADQYMSVFAILLPYTNPSRYNHYIVSLAHHVIAAWFLKCRLNYRRDFVKFIIHGLHNFILLPVEEKFKRPEFTTNMNEDSSNRKRSSSLTEQGSRRREPPSRATLASATGELGRTRGGDSAANMAFHLELTETCIDLMARYTFSPCSVKPKRLATADFMFSGGQSVTWLVGHKLITITTSGCLQNPLKQGLCDRCLTLCKQHIESLPSPQALVPGFAGAMMDPNEQARYDGSNSEIKRYTKYTLQHSRSNETSSSSFSMSDNSLQLPSMSSGQTTRQNSSENKSQSSDAPGQPTSPKIINEGCDSHTQLSLKLESLAKQSWEDRPSCKRMWSRLERLLGSGATSGLSEERPHCACWCSGWAEVHVRRPTGDVSWVMRMQNQMSFDSMSESPLNDIIALLAPTLQGGSPYFGPHGMQPGPSSSNSSGLGDSRNDVLSDGSPRSRSGSTASRGAPPVLAAPPPDLQKSSSDSVVAPGAEKRPPHASTHCIVPVPTQNVLRSHMTTEPINIPGSPQRQNSSSTNTDEDDYQATVGADSTQAEDQGKSRHPVRRSNSSPEMSSSWKSPFHLRERLDAAQELRSDDLPPADDAARVPEASAVPHHLQKKVGKNKDMRVSCEAIPEEIYGGSGTTPPSVPPHPHLMTYNSDPGTTKADQAATQATPASQQNITQVSSDTAINTLVQKAGPTDPTKSALKSDKPTDLTIRTQDSFKLSGKPPQAPAPPSPRLVGRGAGPPPPGKPERTVNLKVNDKVTGFSSDDLPPLSRSKRSNTISVMSPTRKRRDNPSPKSRESSRLGGGGVTPPFVLLQLYHNMGVGSGQNNLYGTAGSSGTLGSGLGAGGPGGSSTNTPWVEKPLLVSGVQHERSVKTLDLVPPLETYKVGVLYVGPGQHDNETKILKNEFGSLRYAEFLHDLGSLIALEDADKYGLFLNVEKGGRDGHFTYVWQDDIMQLHFHVATLMPNNSSDPTCIEKRKHIGNDFVSIVYNDSGEDFQIHTIKGQFNFCIVVIEPLEHGINRVTIKSKDDRIKSKFFNQMESKIISDQNVALLARQLALHCNLASLISRSLTSSDSPPYASNSLERLRIIKRLRARLIQERTNSGENAYYSSTYSSDLKRMNMDDFTEYT